MYDDDKSVIQMIRNGAKEYILLDCEPTELADALNVILQEAIIMFVL